MQHTVVVKVATQQIVMALLVRMQGWLLVTEFYCSRLAAVYTLACLSLESASYIAMLHPGQKFYICYTHCPTFTHSL